MDDSDQRDVPLICQDLCDVVFEIDVVDFVDVDDTFVVVYYIYDYLVYFLTDKGHYIDQQSSDFLVDWFVLMVQAAAGRMRAWYLGSLRTNIAAGSWTDPEQNKNKNNQFGLIMNLKITKKIPHMAKPAKRGPFETKQNT